PNILSLSSTQFVKFTKITFQSTSITSLVHGIVITGNSAYDSIVDCKLLMAIQGSYGNYSINANPLNSNNIGLVFKNNLIQGSYYGIYWFGTSNSNRPYNTVFDGNTIQSAYYSPFTYLYNTLNTRFTNNIVNLNGNNAYNYSYFHFNDSLLFANNVISTGTTVVYPRWELGGNSNQVKIFNNSFNHASPAGNGYLPYLYNTTGYSGFEVKNNIFSCTGAGFATIWSLMPNATMSDNNLYYSATGTVLISGAANLATWRTSCNCDKHSISYRPGYTSNTNLVPNVADSAVWALNGHGTFLPQVPTDINSISRPAGVTAGVPDLGAYEFTPTSIPPVAIASGAPTAGVTQTFRFGSDSVASITWDAFSTPPPFVHIRQYGGKKPLYLGNPLITPNSDNYMYFYDSIYAPSGSYSYYAQLYYHQEWMGNITNEGNLGIVQKTSPNSSPWTLLSTTGVDSNMNYLTGDFITGFGWMTGTDVSNPLPVKLININAHAISNAIKVNWTTASEINSSYFVVERSVNGKSFVKAGTVKANGNSSKMISYTYNDAEGKALLAKGTVYYRLAIYDKDGSREYSKVVAVDESSGKDLSAEVFPNPFNDQVVVNVVNPNGGNINISVIDINGKELYNANFANSNNILNLESIPAGIYFVKVSNNDVVKVVKLIKN
ncbi:MAG: T9SS type A sorting domain-containing protein, partial [Bacteroidota bacterium]|nr:T9SS type A sorting domain-containing protein [Bacteroidota bacterium]